MPRDEVRPARRCHAIRIHESQEDLVHESRRLEGVPGRFPTETTARYPPKFVIDERCGVSLAPGQEQPGYFVPAGVVRHWLVMGNGSVLRRAVRSGHSTGRALRDRLRTGQQ